MLNPYTRHPVLTAMEFAALDQLSIGRGVLGLGAGVKLWIEDPLGIPFARPVTAMRETVEICRALLRGEELSHAGRVFKSRGLRRNAQPGGHHPVLAVAAIDLSMASQSVARSESIAAVVPELE